MKKLPFQLATILPITILAFTLTVAPVSAKIISQNEPVTVSADEVIDDDLFVASQTITIEGTINGDLYAGGGTIDIKGTVNGDVLAAGGTVNVSGIVTQDLRVFAGFVTLSEAQIGDSVSIGSGRLSLDSETTVGGSLMAGSGTFETDAAVGRNLFVGAGTVNINGSVGKDAYIGSENTSVGPDTEIKGNFKYAAEKEASIDPDSTIEGETTQVIPESVQKLQPKDWRGWVRRINASLRAISYLSALLVGALLLRFFLDPTEKIVKNISEKSWSALGWGLIVFFMTLPVLFLLSITVVGLPLAIILGTVFILEIYLAKVFIGILLGQIVVDLLSLQNPNRYLQYALGLAVFYLLTAIPVIGFFTSTAALLFSLGSLFIFKKEALIS